MFFKSIRFKIMLWYMLLLTLTLLAFSSILYGSFSKILYNDLDDLLSSKAEGVVNSITAYWTARDVISAQTAPEEGNFVSAAGEWLETKRKDPELMNIFVQILNTSGERLIASKNASRLAAPSKSVMEDVLDGDDSFDTVKGETTAGKKARFRVYSRPVLHDGKIEYIVQVAGSTSLLTLATQNLAWSAFLLLPLTVLLAGLPGVILARLTLKPVDRMIDTLKQTTAENLKLKIHLPDTKDEIKRLADTLNDMIERLDRSFSSQQNFIQDVSSELKAPLELLRKEIDAAVQSPRSPQEYEALLRNGLKEINKFEKVIEELEILATYDNNRVALEIRKVNLTALLGSIIDSYKERAAEKGIAISSFLRDAIVIDADERQVRQLFESLLDNAFKYTNRKGAIAISASRNKKNAVVTVSDTGIGIEDSELPYIFDRFYRAVKSRVSAGSFGLGLSRAKAVAEVHKGTISVESKFGKGSIFTVSLPVSYSG